MQADRFEEVNRLNHTQAVQMLLVILNQAFERLTECRCLTFVNAPFDVVSYFTRGSEYICYTRLGVMLYIFGAPWGTSWVSLSDLVGASIYSQPEVHYACYGMCTL